MALAPVPAAPAQRPLAPIVAIAALLSLVLWPLEINTAFGLPTHPLIVHATVVFVPLLGLAALAVAISPRLFDRFGLPVAAFAVVTLVATLLTAGAGEAFLEERERTLPAGEEISSTLSNHADAGDALRFTIVLLTLTLVAALFARRPRGVRIALRVLIGLLALTAIFFVVRAGHLGSTSVWDEPPALTKSTRYLTLSQWRAPKMSKPFERSIASTRLGSG